METQPVTEDLHPDFAREALADADAKERHALLEVVHRLPEALDPGVGPAGVRARLLEETSREPERYAPFTKALSELYDLPRADVRALLSRSAEPRAWKRSGLPGIRTLAVQPGPSRRDARTFLVKFDAGVHFPEHQHDGHETVLLMAGGYTERGGARYTAGDIHAMAPGTAHAFTIDADEACVAATLLHGSLNFRSLPLRLLARILGH